MGLVRFRKGSSISRNGYLIDSIVLEIEEDILECNIRDIPQMISEAGSDNRVAHPLSEVTLETPTEPKNIVRLDGCYEKENKKEGDRHVEEAGLDNLENPSLWVAPNSSLANPGDEVSIPKVVEDIRPGVELGIVIGERVRNLEPSTSLESVAGYTVCRTLQAQDENPGLYGYRMFDGFLSVGPGIVPNIDTPLSLGVRKDNTTIDVSSTSELRFSLGELVSYVSEVMTLYPGDIITTGNPVKTQTKLSEGDSVTSWIEGIGRITTQINEGATE